MQLIKQLRSVFCAALCATTLQAQTPVETFEFATQDDLAAAWTPSANAQISLSDSVAPQSTGTKSLKVTFAFPSVAFTTETVTGPELASPLSIAPTQYLSFRIKGDAAFSSADFRNLYLYAYDADGNFGRWGAPVPVNDTWRVANYLASNVEKPWNSPVLPDLTRITHFAFFQYGSEIAIPAYSATIYLDDITVRDAPLVEIPVVTASLLEDFEYTNSAALTAAWKNSPNAIVSSTGSVAAGSSGTNAMQVRFNFPSTAFTTETVTGPQLTSAVNIGTNKYLSFRLKGDPAFASADFRNLYLYAYDAGGNFGRWGGPVPTNDVWTTVNYLASTIEKPWNSSALPDLSRIVQLAFYQYGSEGAIPAYSATIAIDDLAVRDTLLIEAPVTTDKIVEAFEYADADALAAAWTVSANAVVSVTDAVSIRASGQKAMKIDFNFPSGVWATETVRGPELATPIAIGADQYVTYRIQGDSAFSTADFKNLYLYVYDTEGNFGRWGAPVPTTNDWKVFNFRAGTIEQPWDSTALPNLGQIVRFAFFQYGSETAIPAYTASIAIDEIMIRNTPLNEFPAPSLPRNLIENFESYPSVTELLAFYGYVNSPATTVTTASLETPAPQGTKALKLAIDFAPGQYPWGSVRSPMVAPFSFPTNAVLTARFKGDATLASVADAGTTFWITLYDAAGRSISSISPAAVVTSSDWTTIEADLADFGDTSAVDIGTLVQWRILVQGWQGTADNTAMSGTFYVDDIQINVPAAAPSLAIRKDVTGLIISWPAAITGYALETADIIPSATWQPVVTIQGNQATITPGTGKKFYRLRK